MTTLLWPPKTEQSYLLTRNVCKVVMAVKHRKKDYFCGKISI